MPGPLSHSQAHIMALAFVAKGWGNSIPTSKLDTPPWPVYVDDEPGTPDNVIVIYNSANKQEGRSQIDGERQEHEGIMIQLRTTSRPLGWAKAYDIATKLDTDIYDYAVTIGGVAYLVHCVCRTGGVNSLGKKSPDSNRFYFTINAILSVTKRS